MLSAESSEAQLKFLLCTVCAQYKFKVKNPKFEPFWTSHKVKQERKK